MANNNAQSNFYYQDQRGFHGNTRGRGRGRGSHSSGYDQEYNNRRDFGGNNFPFQQGRRGSSHNDWYNRSNNSASQNYSRSRPKDKVCEDHARDQSPDRQDRARPKEKHLEDHKRDPSPERSIQDNQVQNPQAMGSHTDFDYKDQRQHGHSSGKQSRHQQDKYYQGQHSYDRGQPYHRNEYQNRSHQNYRGEGSFDRRRGENTWGEKSDFKLSKGLSFILRHGAEKAGYKMMTGGFLYVDEILKYQNNLRDYTLEDVKRVVKDNDKQRFYMEKEEENGKWKIRANQGHTIEVKDLQLTLITSKDEVPMVVHGTYMDSWTAIQKTGLSRMGRNHIHFAAGEPGENGVISGMRRTCEVMIYIDLEKALADGFKFFRSANNVILCEGNENGVIPPKYFFSVMQRYPRKELLVDKDSVITNVPVGGESLIHGNKGRKKKGKKKNVDGTKHLEKGTDGDEGNKRKREKSEVDESAVEDASGLFEEKMEVEPKPVEKDRSDMTTDTPDSWDKASKENEDVYEQMEEETKPVKEDGSDMSKNTPDNWDKASPEIEEFYDAKDTDSVIIESSVDEISVEDTDSCISSIDYLKTVPTVAVWCDTSEDSINTIAMVTEDKSYFFDIGNHPEYMNDGHIAGFLNQPREPFKVFNGLTSQVSAMLYTKYYIILDGTKLFDLQVACKLMNEQDVGNMNELRQTGYSPDMKTETDKKHVTNVCHTYLKAYTYLSEVMKQCKDFKKELFGMVLKDIDKDELKKLKDERKKELKSSQVQHQSQSQGSKKKKTKKK